jgi:hypothetical protein
MSTKQNNYKYTFFLQLACDESQLKVAIDKVQEKSTTSSILKQMWFKDGDTFWLYFTLDPSKKPFSRNYFKDSHFGGNVMKECGIALV